MKALLLMTLIMTGLTVEALQVERPLPQACLFDGLNDGVLPERLSWNILARVGEYVLNGNSTDLVDSQVLFNDQIEMATASALTACSSVSGGDKAVLIQLKDSNEGAQLLIEGRPHQVAFSQLVDGGTALSFLRAQSGGLPRIVFQISRSLEGRMTYRVYGRLKAQEAVSRSVHFFDENGSLQASIADTPESNASENAIVPLVSLYGPSYQDQLVLQPQVVVGVYGSGVDFNHPGLAKHLVGRNSFEAEAQSLEITRRQLQSDSSWGPQRYRAEYLAYQERVAEVGFPRWMDQARGSVHPFDNVMTPQKSLMQRHETELASRIIASGGQIGLVSVRKLYGYATEEKILDVFSEMNKMGVEIVNMSFAYACPKEDFYEKQWRAAFEKYRDTVFVVAAGNDGKNVDNESYCPAKYATDYKNVISVTALNQHGELASYAKGLVNFGRTVDLALRGDVLPVLKAFNQSVTWSNSEHGGSSMAAAELTRVLAEYKLKNGHLPVEQLKNILKGAVQKRASLEGINSVGGEFLQSLLNNTMPADTSERLAMSY